MEYYFALSLYEMEYEQIRIHWNGYGYLPNLKKNPSGRNEKWA